MRRGFSATVIAAFVAAGCTGGASRDDTIPPLATNPPITAAFDTSSSTSTPTSSTLPNSTTTAAPPTTTDQDPVLAQAESAYLNAFATARQTLREPDRPDNEERLRQSFAGPNLDKALRNLHLTIEGDLVAVEHPTMPSRAAIVEPAQFVDDDPETTRLTVCEFNSDRIFERGTAPDGSDSLRRDDPVSALFVIRMTLQDGVWKSTTGTAGESISSEENQCVDA